MTKPLHSSARTGSGSSAAYHIAYRDGLYRVFDKAGRFRVGFATLPAAKAYIEASALSRAGALPDGRLAWEVGGND